MAKRHLILMHGFLENYRMWDDVLRGISKKDFIIHTPHLPGHHPSCEVLNSHVTGDYLEAILQQMPISSADDVFVVGHSMGGYLASSLVFAMPGRVRGLCLLHSKCAADDAAKIEQRYRAIEAAKADLSLYVHTMINGQFGARYAAQDNNKIKEQITFAKSLSLATIEQSQMMMIHRPDQLLAMQHRSFPLYYFLGQNDPSVTMEMAQLEIDKLPGALAHVEEGIGHMGHWESTRHVAQLINRVLFSAFVEQDV